MNKLRPEETDLVGEWHLVNKKMIGNEACDRIDWLVKNHLKKIAVDWSGWDKLYRDPIDNRYWELIYPESELQGGGPPRLTVISEEEAKKKYKI